MDGTSLDEPGHDDEKWRLAGKGGRRARCVNPVRALGRCDGLKKPTVAVISDPGKEEDCGARFNPVRRTLQGLSISPAADVVRRIEIGIDAASPRLLLFERR